MRTMRLTDAFIWEVLPLTDPDTGYLAMAALIPRIQRVTIFITGFAAITFFIQNSILYFTSDDHPMIYRTWYPFDTTKSPAYELTNISQVTVCVVEYCCTACFISHGTECSLHQARTIG
jgi:hypothetical protein